MRLKNLLILFLAIQAPTAIGKNKATNPIDEIKNETDHEIREIVDPVIARYCTDSCKLLGIDITVDTHQPNSVTPGFEDTDPRSKIELKATRAEVKLLLDDKLGNQTRSRITDLLKQYFTTLEYPVKLNTKLSPFPAAAEQASKITELKERITKQYKQNIEDFIQKYCSKDCLFSDFDLQTEIVNSEEAQYGNPGEYAENSGVALRIKSIGGTLLLNQSLSDSVRTQLYEMAKLKSSAYKNSQLNQKSISFPKIIAGNSPDEGSGEQSGEEDLSGSGTSKNGYKTKLSEENKSESFTDVKSTNSVNTESKNELNTNSSNKFETTTQQQNKIDTKNESKNETSEKFTRIEKIERVEQGDALAGEMVKLRNYGLIFACAVIAMLCFIAFASLRNKTTIESKNMPFEHSALNKKDAPKDNEKEVKNEVADSKAFQNEEFEKKYQMHRLKEELIKTFSENPKVAKQVFSKVLVEEGIQTTAAYLAIFGESVFFEIMKDPSLQNEMSELMEFYAKNPFELTSEEEFELLKRADHRTRASKLGSFVQKSSQQFEFLSELDGHQILELVQNESLTVKAIVITQCDHQKRQSIFNQMDATLRLQMMNELSRIDYLPREYITQVAQALKRKQVDNPRLNTENLPASDVLVGLLEKSDLQTQMATLQSLEGSNAETSRLVKSKLVSIETLPYLPENRVMDVVLSLKHEEMVGFFKGVHPDLGKQILSKTSPEFISDLEDSLSVAPPPSREVYQALERKVINTMKALSQENKIQLLDINQQLFSNSSNVTPLRKVG